LKFKRTKILKKELGLIDVFAIAAGTTLSAGFFLLPGLAAKISGPAMVLAYLVAAVPLVPAMLSKVELATAMPRAGGVYFFLDRSMGPFFGTIGGIGIWLTLILKVTFALIGMGAYLKIFYPELPITTVAIFLAVILTGVNLLGAKKTGKFQVVLVSGLILILIGFIIGGLPAVKPVHFEGFWDSGYESILSTAGLVYISYVGVTKVASLAEEIKNPERNLPLGVFLAMGTAIIIYFFGTVIIVGVEPMDILKGDLTPVATSAKIIFGKTGEILLTVAAIFAFISVANVGTMSASRYPLAMSRDHIFPGYFKKLNRFSTPTISIFLTSGVIICVLLLFNPMSIAKLASAFQLMIFALMCLAVIVMRESKIESYDPGFLSPLYPWIQIIGISTSLLLIVEMGTLSIVFSAGLIILCIIWYYAYARRRVVRTGAIYHLFERLGRQRYEGLDSELRGILIEKGLRKTDPFEQIVSNAKVFDLEDEMQFDEVLNPVCDWLSALMPLTQEEIKNQFLEGTRVGATPVTHGIALPHFRLDKVKQTEMVLVRSKPGVHITLIDPLTHEPEEEQIVNALFFLVSPENNPTQHLRILAQIAGRVDDDNFLFLWNKAETEQELKESLLRNERFVSLTIIKADKTGNLINKTVSSFTIPENCLVVMINRNNKILIPKENTVLKEGDRLTIIGEPQKLMELRNTYTGKNKSSGS